MNLTIQQQIQRMSLQQPPLTLPQPPLTLPAFTPPLSRPATTAAHFATHLQQQQALMTSLHNDYVTSMAQQRRVHFHEAATGGVPHQDAGTHALLIKTNFEEYLQEQVA